MPTAIQNSLGGSLLLLMFFLGFVFARYKKRRPRQPMTETQKTAIMQELFIFAGVIFFCLGLYQILKPLAWLMFGGFLFWLGKPKGVKK